MISTQTLLLILVLAHVGVFLFVPLLAWFVNRVENGKPQPQRWRPCSNTASHVIRYVTGVSGAEAQCKVCHTP